MKRAAQQFVTAFPKSGDTLVDWVFRQFVQVLQSERVKVTRKKRLVNPDDPFRKVVRGLMDPDSHPSGKWVHILINPAKNTHTCRDDEVGTLIHELAHVVMPRSGERSILSIENLLSRRFTASQRRYLKSYIPKHEVKRYPGRISVAL